MRSAPHNRRQHRGVLDDLLGASDTAPAAPPNPAPTPAATAAPTPAVAADRAAPGTPPPAAGWKLTIRLPADVMERARNAVYHSPGLTLAALTIAAFTRELDRLEQQRGEPFPARHGPVRTGRPIR
jgi:hypothetical protein